MVTDFDKDGNTVVTVASGDDDRDRTVHEPRDCEKSVMHIDCR